MEDFKDWKPTPDNINSLPEPIRQYIADLETMCDPAGIIAENTLLRDQIKGLFIKIDFLNKERK